MSRFTKLFLSIMTLSFVGYFAFYLYALCSKRIRTHARALGLCD